MVIASAFVWYSMIGKINRHLPEDQQIPYLFSLSYPILTKPAIVTREYKRLYPNGHLHTVRIVLNVLGGVLVVASAGVWSRYGQ